MKIKKQFILLSAFIIAIPILCIFYISFLHYLRSPERVLLDGTKEIKKIELQSKKFSKQDWIILRNTMKLLPPNVQAVLIDEDKYVLYSTIPEISLGGIGSEEEIWKMLRETSDIYFYQFTSPNLKDFKTMLITRVPREKEIEKQNPEIFKSLIFFLIIFVFICLIIIIFTSKNILNSVKKVEDTAKLLSEGKLETKIETSEKGNEITQTLNNLEAMRQALLEIQNTKNKFFMGISHDLRTPIAVIKGYVEAIRDGFITDKKELNQTLELISGKVNQLEEMIDSLINYTKMNTSEIKEKLKPDCITNLIKTLTSEAKITGTVYKRKIITNINLPNDIIVKMDKQLVTRLFENLYSNAIRYSKENDTIEFDSYEEDNAIILKIKDSGIGISKEDIKNIFDLFYRASSSRQEAGMGIGLSVVKSIIEIHEWDIFVESEIGKGSCFTIKIPFTKKV